MRISIQICTKDRHSELALCLQSLKTQSIQDWDLIILDESKTPITECYFLTAILNRLKFEGHKIKLIRNNNSQGVCFARNKLIEEDTFKNSISFRCDDDVILEKDYIEKLLEVIEAGFDMATGVIPLVGYPKLERENRFVRPIINEHKFNEKGELILQSDDCGFCYLGNEILPTHQFRTNCLYKSEINKKVKYYDRLTKTGFREEGFFSLKAISLGYTIGVHTGAIAYHLSTPTGGVREPTYAQNVALDNETFKDWCKKLYEKEGDFLAEYNKKVVK